MTWQAAAAWIGATLGVINLLLALSGRRPAIYPSPSSSSARDYFPLRIHVISGANPVLIKWIKVWPKKCLVSIISDDEVRSVDQTVSESFKWHEEDIFTKYIIAQASGIISVGLRGHALPKYGLLVVLVGWTDFRFQGLPFTVLLLNPQTLASLDDET